ncbi:Synaptotagmin-4 [Tetrabaena socialis]|uniref:Synaptotagmin-4 n=1 Tax=Tetrabaena socialis TaxID=47790 RepID=A0A2J7ZWL3_9CHLO|nr:Synaptotagmin-4 [Tetrabaena socialis]|eukprot:PNH04667.1 Synaptotagmin-4 [Tetrabaena socialis]
MHAAPATPKTESPRPFGPLGAAAAAGLSALLRQPPAPEPQPHEPMAGPDAAVPLHSPELHPHQLLGAGQPGEGGGAPIIRPSQQQQAAADAAAALVPGPDSEVAYMLTPELLASEAEQPAAANDGSVHGSAGALRMGAGRSRMHSAGPKAIKGLTGQDRCSREMLHRATFSACQPRLPAVMALESTLYSSSRIEAVRVRPLAAAAAQAAAVASVAAAAARSEKGQQDAAVVQAARVSPPPAGPAAAETAAPGVVVSGVPESTVAAVAAAVAVQRELAAAGAAAPVGGGAAGDSGQRYDASAEGRAGVGGEPAPGADAGGAGGRAAGGVGGDGVEGVEVELDFEWRGEPTLGLMVEAYLSPGGGTVRLAPRLRELAVAGTLRLVLCPLLPHPPGFGAIQISMPRAPQVAFAFDFGEALGGAGVAGPVAAFLQPLLQDILAGALRVVVPVLPESVTGPLTELQLRTRGLVAVRVLRAAGLAGGRAGEAPLREGAEVQVDAYTRPDRRRATPTATCHHTRHGAAAAAATGPEAAAAGGGCSPLYLPLQELRSDVLRLEAFVVERFNPAARLLQRLGAGAEMRGPFPPARLGVTTCTERVQTCAGRPPANRSADNSDGSRGAPGVWMQLCRQLRALGQPLPSVHLHAATTAASRSVACSGSPVHRPYRQLPMNESPAPVVSTTASCRTARSPPPPPAPESEAGADAAAVAAVPP